MEVRPIDANVLKECAEEIIEFVMHLGSVGDVKRFIDGAPTLDYAPVKHGTWFYGAENAGTHEVDCSVCGNYANDYYDFCPNCGAKMEE